MKCDICGSKDATVKAEIEGTELSVCPDCSKMGKVIERVKIKLPAKKKKKLEKQEAAAGPRIVQLVVSDYPKIIKTGREKMGLKQEDAAKKLAVKESLLHNIETGHFEPNIELARKLEKFFNITLVEMHKEEVIKTEKGDSDELTIGDMIKVRKR